MTKVSHALAGAANGDLKIQYQLGMSGMGCCFLVFLRKSTKNAPKKRLFVEQSLDFSEIFCNLVKV